MATLPATRPELDADALPWWLCISGMASGLLLVLTAMLDGGGAHVHAVAGHAHTDHVVHLLMIIGMTLIMMSPFAFPLLRTVARTTLWTESAMAAGAAWVGFIGVWCVAAVGMHLLGELVALSLTNQGAVVVLTALCVVAQLCRRRNAMLGACQRTRPMRPGSPISGGLRWGSDGACRCIQVCSAPMTLMALTPALAAAATITALLWLERFSERRRELRTPLAFGYLVIGASILTGASV